MPRRMDAPPIVRDGKPPRWHTPGLHVPPHQKHMRPIARLGIAIVALMLSLQGPVRAAAPLTGDPRGTILSLPATASPHWVWVNDFVFPHMPDGQALLVDGDSGRFLGMLSTGISFGRLVPAKDGKLIFSPETYFSRG